MSTIRYKVRPALRLGAILSILIATFFLVFDTETRALFPEIRRSGGARPNHPIAILIASSLLGMGLGSLAVLFWVNRSRLRAVFRPNTGRVLGAFALALCVPLGLFGPMPVTFLGLFSANFIGESPVTISKLVWRFSTLFQDWQFSAFIFVALPVAYVFSSLIISGVQSRLVRVLLFGQVWLATYGAAILLFGFHRMVL